MTTDEVWKKSRGLATIDLVKLQESNLESFYGELQLNNNGPKLKVNCFSDKIKIG